MHTKQRALLMLQILIATLARWTLRASYSLEASEPNINITDRRRQ